MTADQEPSSESGSNIPQCKKDLGNCPTDCIFNSGGETSINDLIVGEYDVIHMLAGNPFSLVNPVSRTLPMDGECELENRQKKR